MHSILSVVLFSMVPRIAAVSVIFSAGFGAGAIWRAIHTALPAQDGRSPSEHAYE